MIYLNYRFTSLDTSSYSWNLIDIDPQKDLLTYIEDFAEAVRNQNLRMGFYYSLYELVNPIYLVKDKVGMHCK